VAGSLGSLPEGWSFGCECIDVLVVACGGNQYAGQRITDLTAVSKGWPTAPRRDLFGCRIIEDDRRDLPPSSRLTL